eukprot:3250564-Pyramimonas_sp.AAC.1
MDLATRAMSQGAEERASALRSRSGDRGSGARRGPRGPPPRATAGGGSPPAVRPQGVAVVAGGGGQQGGRQQQQPPQHGHQG